MPRLLLLMATRTYRATAFIKAARKLGGDVVIGCEQQQALAHLTHDTSLTLDLPHPQHALASIVAFARVHPLDAVVGVDDDTTLIAAMAADALTLRGNSVESVQAAQNKYAMRDQLARAGIPSPDFALLSTDTDPRLAAMQATYPCVLKPVFLAASRGVIRANDSNEFVAAFRRISSILAEPDVRERGGEWASTILVESFIPGFEVALEGMLHDGQLEVLALFDKPDPLDGPFFEETIYLTPSRLAPQIQTQIEESVRRTTTALGLRDGPVHAELRVNEQGAWIVEIAARSIGGLCSSVLQFSTGLSLEDLILRHALGVDPVTPPQREPAPAGVMMLPIPRAGTLRAVRGKEAALATPEVSEIDITIPLGQPVVPLPEGDRYLGFIFARGTTQDGVEGALREAHRRLEFVIE